MPKKDKLVGDVFSFFYGGNAGGNAMKNWSREERYRVLKSPEEIRDLYERIKKTPYRQTYHIQPVTGLLNDPNGFVWHDGKWHLFYQWCPWGAVHGLKYWYQTVSRDLITWENVGVTIKPDCDLDNKGAYSGSAWPEGDKLQLFYTGNHRDPDWTRIPYTCMYTLFDDNTGEKKAEPLFGPHPDYTEHQRDPKILFDEETGYYYICNGGQTKDKKGCMLIYRSKSLSEGWEFAGKLNVPGFEDFGGMWECPAIERIGDKDVLIFCPQHMKLIHRGDVTNHNGYILGTMDWSTLTFTPDGKFHVLDFGFDSYAAECANNSPDPASKILVAWMGLPDSSYPTDEDEWSGCLTLPRELRIRDRRLIQVPLPGLEALRGDEVDPADGILPEACEMIVKSDGGNMTLSLFTKADGTGGIMIYYDAAWKMVTVDRSGLTKRFNIDQGEMREHPTEFPLSTMRIFIDRSSVEIFVNEGDAVFSSRVFPTEEEQFQIYREVLEKMRGRKVIIRTLDLGTDKQASYFRPEKENNPAMGYRAIRISLSQPELFKTQLRALYRASVYGNLDILFPLIISLDEIRHTKMIIKEVTDELDAENIEYRQDLRLGIMIETPAAVMISDKLAKEVDFFSIGTNDLTQFTLAIDRQNPKLEAYFNEIHPAVMKMIEMTVNNAHKAGIPVDICGEAAADLGQTQKFIDMGIDALSVSPNMVLPLRKKIRECE